jgi:cellulose biosynthesis protein BcsQ
MSSERPKIVAFYAYKGGTGRTFALMHTAWALAREGRRIVVIDLDLSAPSIGGLVGKSASPGFVELVRDWRFRRTPAVRDALVQIPLDSRARGALYALPAGQIDEHYLDDIEQLDWRLLLEPQSPWTRPRKDLFDTTTFFQEMAQEIAETVRADAIFLDAPTGLNDTANVCLRVLADAVIAIFAPNLVQIEGIARVVSLLTAERAARKRGGAAPRPDVLCVASTLMHSRVGGADFRLIQQAFDYLARVRYKAIGEPGDLKGEDEDIVLQQPVLLGYDERLANVDMLATRDEPREAWFREFDDIARFVDSILPSRSETKPHPSLVEPEQHRRILDSLQQHFRERADEESDAELKRIFLRTSHIDEVGHQGVTLILGGKGAGKTALFRFLSTGGPEHVAVHGGPVGYARELLQVLSEKVGPERLPDVWRLHLLARLSEVSPSDELVSRLLALHHRLETDRTALEPWYELFRDPVTTLALADAWRELDEQLGRTGGERTLYMDKLDVTFASDEKRDQGLVALFLAWQATLADLRHIRLKVFLRTDLWNRLVFPEKSHLKGREQNLTWQGIDLWRMILRRLFACDLYVDLSRRLELPQGNPESMAESAMHDHLDALFDRHIWAGKNSLTRNWIRRRLEDAGGTVFPRDVVVLLRQAMQNEVHRVNEGRPTSDRALITRQSLSEALEPTSEQRVAALIEEYPELYPSLNALKGLPAVGPSSELRNALGRTLGKDVAEEIRRLTDCNVLSFDKLREEYRVPDLYRHGLLMPRLGPR